MLVDAQMYKRAAHTVPNISPLIGRAVTLAHNQGVVVVVEGGGGCFFARQCACQMFIKDGGGENPSRPWKVLM